MLLGSVATGAQTEDSQITRKKLELVESQIEQLESRLTSFRQEQSALQRELKRAEIALGKIQRDISNTEKQLKFKRNQLAELKNQRSQLMASRSSQQALIEREIQTAYQVGREGKLKLLLNQKEPQTLARALAYYDYFNRARNNRIDNFMSIIRRIDEIEPEIQQASSELAATRAELELQLSSLEQNRQRRSVSLASLSASISTDDQKLKQLSSNRKEFERLLSAIEEAVADLEIPFEIRAFDEARGAMPWPVDGKAQNRFGRSRTGSSLKWQGLLIAAPEGSTIGAIHHGRVVFADWFRGSGLLLILDHGDGYMSMYGHNQSLLREVGEWVSVGDPIGTVGNSGGQAHSALYFEIRKDGKPTDPVKWCKKG
ncbi:MAG: septal ring factor EnvC (AmiA/AmiB activator) [Halieaceae bacterium]|jgi:septal ring factor EnvC (AmiA/AmiB activator)